MFNFPEFRKKEVYKSFLKEEEDVDFEQNKGWYKMNDDFMFVILATY